MRDNIHHHFAVQFHNSPEHAVGAGMMRAKVEFELFASSLVQFLCSILVA